MLLTVAFGLLEWLLIGLSAVLLNVIPAFMPPTWTVLAWAHFQHSAEVIPLALVGAAGAVTGRALLALAGRLLGTRIIPQRWRRNITILADTLRSRTSWGVSTLALTGLGAIPTNQVFLAAGIAQAPIRALLLVFGVSRFVGYIFWITVADTAVSSIGDALRPRLGSGAAIAGQVIAFILLIVVMQIDWGPLIRRFGLSQAEPDDRQGSTS